MRRLIRWIPLALGAVIAGLLVLAALTSEPGQDYEIDPATPIDALASLNWERFFATQPLMGSLSLVVRAPFVALVFEADVRTIYLIGALPCVIALGVLLLVLVRRMARAGRSGRDQAIVAVAVLASPLTVKALHWGHPEELLGAAFCAGAVLAAAGGRGVWAGVLLGAAISTKQWGVLAGVPVLLATPVPQRVRMVAVGAAVVALFTVPMVVGNPDRFWLVMEAAASPEPSRVLGVAKNDPFDGAPVTPTNLFWPLSDATETKFGTVHLVPLWLGKLSHPLIVLVALGLLVGLRRRTLQAREALLLLALIFSMRGLLDVMSLDYYHVPLLVALGAAAAVGSARDALVALAATAGLSVAFSDPATGIYGVVEHAAIKNPVYLLVAIPLFVHLAREVLAARNPDVRPSSPLESPAPVADRGHDALRLRRHPRSGHRARRL